MMNKKVESFHDLVVWQKSHEMVKEVFKISSKFPKKDQSYLSGKLRDAAVIIPSNIAIGFQKRGKKTKVHYYRIALTEIEQLRYLLILAEDLGFHKGMEELLENCVDIEKMLKRLIRSIASQT